MVFYFEDAALLQTKAYEKYLPLLPAERRAKALSYRRAADRNCCVFAWLLLHYACREQGYALRQLRLQVGAFGKPFFGGPGVLHFNLSHCSQGAACGISTAAIGIDMQEMVYDYESIWDRACSPGEKKRIQQDRDPVRRFTAFWVLKEAYLKCLGTGLDDDLARLDFQGMQGGQGWFYDCCFQLWERSGCLLAQCTARPEAELRAVSLEELAACAQ